MSGGYLGITRWVVDSHSVLPSSTPRGSSRGLRLAQCFCGLGVFELRMSRFDAWEVAQRVFPALPKGSSRLFLSGERNRYMLSSSWRFRHSGVSAQLINGFRLISGLSISSFSYSTGLCWELPHSMLAVWGVSLHSVHIKNMYDHCHLL